MSAVYMIVCQERRSRVIRPTRVVEVPLLLAHGGVEVYCWPIEE